MMYQQYYVFNNQSTIIAIFLVQMLY